MTFPPPDMHRFLLESIPGRFSQLTQEEFASFIQYLFQLDGYEVQDTVNSSTFGLHIRAVKDNHPEVILPLRLPADESIQKETIQKAVQARELYKSAQAWVITTSSFTPESRILADQKDVEIWDWNELYAAICQLFFEGKSHLEYVAPPALISTPVEEDSPLKLKVKWEAQEGVTNEWLNLDLRITNPTHEHIYVHFDLPVLIDGKKQQVAADQWGEEDFVSGVIYSGATVRTNALFRPGKIGDRPAGGKIILTCHERREVPVTFHLSARLKGEACYFVTYCYGRESQEYRQMTKYRDRVLMKNWIGKSLVSLYYFLSPRLIGLADRSLFVRRLVKTTTKWLVKNTIGSKV